jgi:hypothetical protein
MDRPGGLSYLVALGLVVAVLLEPVFLVLCFLAFLAGAVLVLSGVVWLGAGVDCAKVRGRLAAAKAIASKLFFMVISPCGILFSRHLYLEAEAVLIR